MEFGTLTLVYRRLSDALVEASLVEHPEIRGQGRNEEDAREMLLSAVLGVLEADRAARILAGLGQADRMVSAAYSEQGSERDAQHDAQQDGGH